MNQADMNPEQSPKVHDVFPPYQGRYAQLPQALHRPVMPYGASAPRLLALNEGLLEVLGFDRAGMSDELAAQIFAGNQLAGGSQPLAMAYAGHQFGGFNPGLGDGRALLLGEVMGSNGTLYDIQLKGSGQTPFSRQGDGRAALGPVLREYVISEAMAALGIPTTRALAAVITGDPVLREGVQPGAMVTRVASSHLRVGTFEYAAQLNDHKTLSALSDFAVQRHYSDLDADGPPALRLLKGVIERQAYLVARWMGVGFIHGVMNTDNCTISGETIDYGPCAFMDAYNPGQVYSSIDHQGRYAFANQPPIAHWNMAVLAQALLPLIDSDEAQAVKLAQNAVNAFPAVFQDAYQGVMARKLGLGFGAAQEGDESLVRDLLTIMADNEADFTNSFVALTAFAAGKQNDLAIQLGTQGDDWIHKWETRTAQTPNLEGRLADMRQANPVLVPRNHRVEAMIQAGYKDDFGPFAAMNAALASPFTASPTNAEAIALTMPPLRDEVVHATFCGT